MVTQFVNASDKWPLSFPHRFGFASLPQVLHNLPGLNRFGGDEYNSRKLAHPVFQFQ